MISRIRVGDLTVNRLGFGAMRICGPNVWGPPKDRDAAHRVLRRALELGVDFLDTADSYGPHVDEDLIAEALHPYPKGLVIATKGGLLRPRPGAWDRDGRPEHLKLALEGSLKRLKVERIDLYQLHAPDPKVPLEDSLGAIVDAQKAGKIRHIGVSNVNEDQLDQALAIAPVVSVQNRYGPGARASEDLVDRCELEGLAFLPWAPLDQGGAAQNPALERIARDHGATPRQVALAWLLARSPVMLPIPGTGSVTHLEENIAARALALTPEDIAELNRT
jgi:aryl-alcohol dehydrogenase-like predicted oxidoreductase